MKEERITLNEIPELMRALCEGTEEEYAHALMLLCPCRNRVYDRKLWEKIFLAWQTNEGGDQPDHNIETLRRRAVRDPRAQELLLQLDEDLKTGKLFSSELSKVVTIQA